MQVKTLTRIAACFIVALGLAAHAEDKKVDAAGTWKWSFTGNNGQSRETTLTLKMDGDKLSGSISGRNGDTPISDATLKGDQISFQISREFNGNKMTQKYNGTISGDEIKGKVESKRGDSDPQTRDWTAKRAAAKAKAE